MNLSEPATALAPGLSMPLLTALAHRGSPASSAQLQRAAGTGTVAGVQRALERWAQAGLVESDVVAGRNVYRLNTEHVLYPAVRALFNASGELRRRLDAEITSWDVQPMCAALFGSAARADGGLDSDIDLLLIRPGKVSDPDADPWAEQSHTLREHVQRWTGNRLQIVDHSLDEVTYLVRAREPVVEEWRRDALTVAGRDIRILLREDA